MKHTTIFAALLLVAVAVLSGCGSVLHNGTEMAIERVTLTGLPSAVYAEGQEMVFSYNMGDAGWIHDDANAALFAMPKYRASVAADGSLVFNFGSPIEIVTPTLTFLLIDPDKTWATLKIDLKHSGKSGGDVVLDNTWAGAAAPERVLGVVSGDDVAWDYE
ncbi:MAG: hypothetical protein JXA15_08470 [Spirochaetales bacterium]|nr:hypothetical protein [Spirochaetales bacterium]